ncbi:MAG: murein biosynthesis integral membrane protein MurJ [Clostridia bacterium]|nr:murein biosynthesis integral membrane protein MurJ [Clostridia bacterium]
MSEKKKPGLLGYAAVMSVITVVSKLLGLLRDILVARSYGTNMESVAYVTASRLPTYIFDFVIGGVVTAAFIPVFNSILVKKGKDEAFRFANSYVNFILIATTAIAAAGILLAGPLVRVLAPDIDAETAALAANLSRIMFPMIIFTGLAFSFVGVLQSMGEYNIPALISLVSNVIMVGYLFTINRFFGIVGLSVAMVIGWAAQAFVQVPKLRGFGYRYRPCLPTFDSSLRQSLKNAVPILIGTWTTPICAIINNRLASSLNEGRAITALDYANRLYIIIVGVFSFVATNLLFPYMSRAEADGDREETTRLIRTSSKALTYIIAPIAVGVALLARPFIAVVYQRGEFTAADTVFTAEALRAYCVGMVFMAINEVIVKSLFAANRPKAPMASSLISMTFNIVLITVLRPWLGVGGIALVSGIATIVNLAVNLIFAAKRRICVFTGRDVLDMLKSVLSAAAMVPYLLFVVPKIGSDVLSLVAGAFGGAAIYLIVSLILFSEEPRLVLGALRSKAGGKK